ncbi:MAG: ECF transporter S component [Lachnospiraceae bacterium]|nr:ECF transporter S component [Lachnospiraceae bacterium]
MKNLWTQITENLDHVAGFAGTVAAMFLIAFLFETYFRKRNKTTGRILSTKKVTMIGMFSAIAMILHLFDFPIPFLAPGFYKLDLSEIPVLICAFAYGPVAGVFTEFCKILLKLLFKSTSTAFVGDLANFAVGCVLVLPASILYQFKKTKKRAILSCAVGTLCMAVFGAVFNAVYLLPAFAVLFMGDAGAVDSFVAMGHDIIPLITDVTTFALFSVAPINILKGIMASIPTMLIYKPLSPLLKDNR